MTAHRARRSVDAGRLSQLVARPGIDPRVWLTLAVVDQLGFDAREGPFADVTFVPTGERETCLIAAAGYAGNGFGLWGPLEVQDVVLVALPNGDPNSGPVVIARMWRAADAPSVDFKAAAQDDGHDVPSADVVLRVKSGQKLVIRTAGDAGEVDIQVEGNTHVRLRAGGQVRMQDASRSFMRTEDFNDQLNTFLTALNTFASGLIALVPTPPNAAATAAALQALGTALQPAVNAFNNARTGWVSSKVKGQ